MSRREQRGVICVPGLRGDGSDSAWFDAETRRQVLPPPGQPGEDAERDKDEMILLGYSSHEGARNAQRKP